MMNAVELRRITDETNIKLENRAREIFNQAFSLIESKLDDLLLCAAKRGEEGFVLDLTNFHSACNAVIKEKGDKYFMFHTHIMPLLMEELRKQGYVVRVEDMNYLNLSW